MNWSSQISSAKNIVINSIVNDPDIVSMIDNPNITDPDDLIYANIWDSWRIPETETWKETHICVKCDVDNTVAKTSMIKRMYLWVLVMTHQDLQRVNRNSAARGCNRIDFISQRIEDLINRSVELGLGEAKLISNIEGSVDAMHPCREIRFMITGINSNFDCGWSSE